MEPITLAIRGSAGEVAVNLVYPVETQLIKKGAVLWTTLGEQVLQAGHHVIPALSSDILNALKGTLIGKYRDVVTRCCTQTDAHDLIRDAQNSAEEIGNVIKLQYSAAQMMAEVQNKHEDPFNGIDAEECNTTSGSYKRKAEALLAEAVEYEKTTKSLSGALGAARKQHKKLMTSIQTMGQPPSSS